MLSEIAGEKATVIAFYDQQCPVSQRYAPRLVEIEREYVQRGVGFLFVNVSQLEPETRIIGTAIDPEGRIARELGATHSTDVFVLDAERRLRYRGAVDDQHGIGFTREAPKQNFLREALEAVLAGGEPATAATIAPGCVLNLPAQNRETTITYHARISRVVQERCQTCHREDGPAPFALDSYIRVRSKRGMIRQVLEQGIMPPWGADARHGPFLNDPSLTAAERDALLHWIAVGCPEGDPADAPPLAVWPAAEAWAIGEPDAVFQVPHSFTVPAQGVVDYKHAYIKTDFPEDRWLRAIEIKPTAPRVVHHVLVQIEEPRRADESREQFRRRSQGGLTGYFAGLVPGANSVIYPAGYAKRLPKGATLKFQIHYTPNGEPATDQPRIGFVFADGPPVHEVHTRAVFNHDFVIPPGERAHRVTASIRFDRPGLILAFSPHMHLRGRAFRYDLTTPGPGGHTRTVLDVPRYDFNWQWMYRLRDPLYVPAGSVLTGVAWFDNSAENPANPDPAATVDFGEQTWEEMMIGYFEWTAASGDGP